MPQAKTNAIRSREAEGNKIINNIFLTFPLGFIE
jgi:hypothetical protein